ncbi:MAG: hypothetical protein K2Y39_05180 [Candidatus Obscuribacterales bacterium]|nr:hypothetical protein [Candidatus Obscuribacterales bacterium]
MPGPKTTTLYRPVGAKELELIAQSQFLAFPPRLYFQPIFYPVMNEEYATQIARDWNTKDEASGYVGYVTRFEVNSEYLANFEVQVVGAADVHQEYWIPAEQLDEFNRNILGKIEVISTFVGEKAKQ